MAAESPAAVIDSHAHLLHLKSLTPQAALAEAQRHGVRTVVNIGDGEEDNQPGIELAEQIPGLRTTVGWHPHHADTPLTPERRRRLRRQAAHPAVAAIGEIGLDYHFTDWHRVPVRTQQDVLRHMLAFSQEVGKPVVLHTREAFPDLFRILDEFPGISGVFHCFSGNAASASEALARGFHVSFAATVTYPGAHAVQGAACVVPLERLLVETDAPFLPPQSRRGQPNTPAYIWETVERIGQLCGIAAGEVAAASCRNAVRLFGLPVD